jgi:hypothetical protein
MLPDLQLVQCMDGMLSKVDTETSLSGSNFESAGWVLPVIAKCAGTKCFSSLLCCCLLVLSRLVKVGCRLEALKSWFPLFSARDCVQSFSQRQSGYSMGCYMRVRNASPMSLEDNFLVDSVDHSVERVLLCSLHQIQPTTRSLHLLLVLQSFSHTES